MRRRTRLFVLTFIFATLSVGVFNMNQNANAAAAAKPKNCFLLLYNDCFNNWDFKPNEKTWSRSAVTIDLKTFAFFRNDIVPPSPWTKSGVWFRWTKSFFMQQLCSAVMPPDICNPEPGLPVYGGSFSGTTGQGLMTNLGGGFAFPVCWYMKAITKGNYQYCPILVSTDASGVSDEGDEEAESVEEENLDEVAAKFMELWESWVKGAAPSLE